MDSRPAQVPPLNTAAQMESNEQRYERIASRRGLAHQVISDMRRLLLAWRDNSLTTVASRIGGEAVQSLTVTLDEAKIDAITREFQRLAQIDMRTREAVADYELQDNHALSVGCMAEVPATPRPLP